MKYGGNSPKYSDEIKQKEVENNYRKYGVKSESTLRAFKKIFESVIEEAEPLFTKEEFDKRTSINELFKWKCKFCRKNF